MAQTKKLPWTKRELVILSRYASMSDERIRHKLKAAGYARTVTWIHLNLKRMTFKYHGAFYSVTRWIKSGHLKAKTPRESTHSAAQPDSYLIQEKDVHRFILEQRPHRSNSA